MNMSKNIRFAAVLAIIVQLIGVFTVTSPWMRSDSPFYLAIAHNLSQGFFSYDGVHAEATWPPGYPAILAVLHEWLQLPIAAIIALQLGLLAVAITIVSRLMDDKPRTIFLLLCAFYPMPALYLSAVMSEAWALLAVSVVATLLLRVLSVRVLLVIGIICGVAALIRPSLALLPFVVGAYLLFNRHGWRSALPLVVAAGVLMPYAVWNAVTFGKASPLPVAAATGTSLYLATWQSRLPSKDINALYQGQITPRAERAGLGREVTRLNREIGAPPLHVTWSAPLYPPHLQVRANEVLRRAALEQIVADPISYGRHVARNAWALWNTSEYPSAVPAGIATVLMLTSAVIFVLGAIGCFLNWRHPAAWVLAYFPAVHLWLHTEARYTAPARLLLLLMAALALERIWQMLRQLGRNP